MQKWMSHFMVFHTLWKNAKSLETIVFTIENVVLGMQKRFPDRFAAQPPRHFSGAKSQRS